MLPADPKIKSIYKNFSFMFKDDDAYNRLLSSNEKKKLVEVFEEKAAFYSPEILEVVKYQNVTIGYYLQSFKYFRNVQNELRDNVSFPFYIVKMAVQLLVNVASNVVNLSGIISNISNTKTFNLSGKQVVLVGVHIRRGDLLRGSE